MYIPIYHDLQHALASLMLVLLVAGEWGFCYQTMYTYMVPLHMSVERVEYILLTQDTWDMTGYLCVIEAISPFFAVVFCSAWSP